MIGINKTHKVKVKVKNMTSTLM